MLNVNDSLWIISDTHIGHKNIVRLTGRPDDHEDKILASWAALVQPDDQILHLGDVAWRRTLLPSFAILPGEKFLIRGNHDRKITDSAFQSHGFTLIDPFIHDQIAFTHQPVSDVFPAPPGPWKTNVHGHTHGNDHHDKDGERVPGRRYIDVSVEVQGYQPRRLGEIFAA